MGFDLLESRIKRTLPIETYQKQNIPIITQLSLPRDVTKESGCFG